MALMLVGCSREKDLAAWRIEDIVGWRYELISDEAVLVYRFHQNGVVAVQAGVIGGPLASPMDYWAIDENGSLVVSGSDGVSKHYQLISFTKDSARVRVNGNSELFHRSPIGQR